MGYLKLVGSLNGERSVHLIPLPESTKINYEWRTQFPENYWVPFGKPSEFPELMRIIDVDTPRGMLSIVLFPPETAYIMNSEGKTVETIRT